MNSCLSKTKDWSFKITETSLEQKLEPAIVDYWVKFALIGPKT